MMAFFLMCVEFFMSQYFVDLNLRESVGIIFSRKYLHFIFLGIDGEGELEHYQSGTLTKNFTRSLTSTSQGNSQRKLFLLFF